ncbi:MAG: hypothetical protein SNF93_07270 [Rikenellaceae bacterium]
MRRAIPLFALLLTLVNSCVKFDYIDHEPGISKQRITVDVYAASSPTSDEDTRIGLDADAETWVTSWEQDDVLSGCSPYTSTMVTTPFEVVSIDESDAKHASFSGSAEIASDLYLIYPYEQNVVPNNGKYPIDISLQSIDPNDKYNSYADAHMYMVSDMIPITATGQVSSTPSMHHTMASMELEIQYGNFISTDIPIVSSAASRTSISASINDASVFTDQKLYRIEISADDLHSSGSIDMATRSIEGSSVGTIAINLDEVVAIDTDQKFYIPFAMIPYSPQSALTIKLFMTDGENTKKVATITKSSIPDGLSFEAGKHSTITCELITADVETYWDFAGSGTQNDPYQISTLNDMWILSNNVNAGGTYENCYLKLINDINLGVEHENIDTSDPSSWWKPIGANATDGNSGCFRGTFDGGGYTIDGVFVDNTDDVSYGAVGLFGNIGYGGVVKNLYVVMSTSHESAPNGTGAIAGRNYGTIHDCSAQLQTFEKKYNVTVAFRNFPLVANYVGGIVGRNESGIVANCYRNSAYIRIKGECLGGIAGWSSGQVVNCYNFSNDTDLLGLNHIGGIVGYLDYPEFTLIGATVTSTSVENCFNRGWVGYVQESERDGYTIGDYAANIVGYAEQGSTITNCVNLMRESDDGVQYILAGTDATSSLGFGSDTSEIITSCYYPWPSNYGNMVIIGQGTGVQLSGFNYEFIEKLNATAREINTVNSTNSKFEACAWGPGNDHYSYPRMDSNDFISLCEGEEPLERGSKSNPYMLATHFDLELLAGRVNGGNSYKGSYFELHNDICYNIYLILELLEDSDTGDSGDSGDSGGSYVGSELYSDPKYIEDTMIDVIGNETNRFEGHLNGNAYTFNQIYINGSQSQNEVALFGVLGQSGVIENVGFLSGELTSSVGGVTIAPLVARNYGTINNCYTTISQAIKGSQSYDNGGVKVTFTPDTRIKTGASATIGGIVGENMPGATLSNVYTYTVNLETNSSTIGGIVGKQNDGASMAYCYYYSPYFSCGVGNGQDESATTAVATMAKSSEFVDLLNSSQSTTRWYYWNNGDTATPNLR